MKGSKRQGKLWLHVSFLAAIMYGQNVWKSVLKGNINSYRCNSELPAVWRHEGCDVLRQRRWTLDVDAVNILTNLSDQRSRHRQLLIFTWRFQQVTCCLCV